MTYDEKRDSEQLRIGNHLIDDFVRRFKAGTGTAAGARHTVILFPGGMASCLERARDPYDPAQDSAKEFEYDVVWLNEGSLLGGARDLRMNRIAPGTYTDKDDRIVVADGAVGLLNFSLYDDFTDWCGSKGLDWFVLGWDWRRRIEDNGRFFLEKFLPHFRQRVMTECNVDPLTKISLIGHSAGGPLVNWILRERNGLLGNLHRAITVAGPFYGYGGQAHRWFEGEPLLNGLFDIFKSDIIRAICSFPTCYTWMYMPYATFQDNEAALGADPAYPLTAYPSRDHATGGIADPYNPQTNGNRKRYPDPGQTGFDADELADGRALVEYLASPLPSDLAQIFVNIRCDTEAGDTVGCTTWDWAPPNHPSPIVDGAKEGGDDTMPAWTARHVGLAAAFPANVITVTASDAEHAVALSSSATQAKLAGVLGVP